MNRIIIKESEVIDAAKRGMDDFIQLFYDHIMKAIGGELNADTMTLLNPEQITLVAYVIFRSEVMDGGFIQLIHNGYGPFIFHNPFAKAMNQWGAHEFRNLLYKGRKLFDKYQTELTREATDEEFMALFESYPEFDDLDDEFVEAEEELTAFVAEYVDEHIDHFAEIEKGGKE